MQLNRRHFFASGGALALSACVSGGAPSAMLDRAKRPSSDLEPVANQGFANWIADFVPRARSAGISDKTLKAAFADVGYLPGVITRDRTQIQTRRTLEEYLSIATSDERLTKGRLALSRHKAVLDAIENQYGVSMYIVAAIWGMESQFGEKRGQIPVVSSTATLAFEGRRGAFYETQLLAALRILDRGETTPDKLTGSWAGAMGHTQFIPTSFQSFAVDFDGDGRRDVWGNAPGDALASTASYLARNGWRSGLKWGGETGPDAPQRRLIQPQRDGVRFSVTKNFDVLKTYNNSDFYAIGVGHLADRLGGAGPLRGTFPPDANGLTKADRLAVQRGLKARGYDIGTIDGVMGSKTEAAIRDYQKRQGLTVTGTANQALLASLG